MKYVVSPENILTSISQSHLRANLKRDVSFEKEKSHFNYQNPDILHLLLMVVEACLLWFDAV